MSFLSRVDADLKAALRQSDTLKLSVLRLTKSALTYKQIEKGAELSNDEALAVIASLLKQRRESVEQYLQGGRPELADKERQEMEILQSYLPAQLGQEDPDRIITEAIAESGAQGESDLGKVMKLLMPRVKGLADGKLVNARVRELLSAPR